VRVLFLSVSGALGGAERVLLELVAALRSLHPEWTLGVVCLEAGPLVTKLEALGADVRVLPLPPRFAAVGESGRSTGRTLLDLAESAWSLRAFTSELRETLAAWRPDVVHANGLKAHVLSAWTAPAAARIAWHVHDYVGGRRISSVLLRLHARRVAVVVANSHSVAADLRAVLGTRARIAIVHNGIDTRRFRPDGPMLDLDALCGLPQAPRGTVRVGLVATYARWKGHDVFLRALAALVPSHPIRGYVIGGPVYLTTGSQYSRQELVQRARALGLENRVGFGSFLEDTAPALRSLDVVVHASTAPEPFGLTVAEAMSSGRAVIATDSGGVAELVLPGQTALTHPAGDDRRLAERIALLAGNSALRQRLGANARTAAVTMFDRRRVASALAALYAAGTAGEKDIDTPAGAHAS
jgi:glycosyltransferase involved in cell wall biosynthesis